MKCFFKRSLSFCISLIMLFSIFTVFQIPLMATGSVKLRLDSFIEEYPAGQKWNDSFAGGFQCYGFAKLVIYNLFGNKNSGYRSWKYDGTPTNGMTVLGSVTNFSSDNVWALLSLAECGDVLQFDSPKQHSMIVYSVVSDGAWIYDCNYLMTNTINLRKVSFGEWYGKNSNRLTLLRADNYDLIDDSDYTGEIPDEPVLPDDSIAPEESCECMDIFEGTYICTTRQSLRIRSGHGTSYSTLTLIPYGAEVQVTKAGYVDSNGMWAHVIYGDIEGFACMTYLERKSTSDNDSSDEIPEVCSHSETELRDKVDVTCTENGYTGDTYCIQCSMKILEGQVVLSEGHKWSEWITDNNNHWKKCLCGEVSEFKEHTYGPWETVIEPTEISEGLKRRMCSDCGQIDEDVLAKLEHEHHYSSDWEFDIASHWKKCECGTVSELNQHSGGTATCTDSATCSVCGQKYGSSSGHSYKLIDKMNADHSNDGMKSHYRCEVCGKYFDLDKFEVDKNSLILPALGHSGGSATCTEKAICEVCGDSYGELIDHSYDYSLYQSNESGHWHKCLNCDACTEIRDHIPGPEATTTTPRKCIECDYILIDISVIYGDVNLSGEINMDDVIMLLRHISKASVITNSESLSAGEIVDDGELNMDDVIRLLRFVSKAIPELK